MTQAAIERPIRTRNLRVDPVQPIIAGRRWCVNGACDFTEDGDTRCDSGCVYNRLKSR